MAQVEKRLEIYDETGLISVETIMVEEEPLANLIEQKEQELIRIYNEIEALKARQ
jgi:hypothetical protein